MADLSEADVQRIAEAITLRLGQKEHPVISHDQASNIAAAAARTTVQELTAKSLAMLGINPADSKQLDALKENIAFIQRLRVRSEKIGQSVANAVANAVALGLIGLLIIGFLVWARTGEGAGHLPPSIK